MKTKPEKALYVVRFLHDRLDGGWRWCICKRGSWAAIARNFNNRAEADIACARFNEGKYP